MSSAGKRDEQHDQTGQHTEPEKGRGGLLPARRMTA